MKRTLFVLIFTASLSGCVGFSIHGNKDEVVSKIDFSRVESFGDRKGPPNRAPDKQYPDGTVMYVLTNETAWCGAVIWAVIPVPLLLPVCLDRTEMTYKDGKPIQMRSQWTGTTHGAACGPFMPLLGLSGSHVGFCGSLGEHTSKAKSEQSASIEKKKPHPDLEAAIRKGMIRKATPPDAQEWLDANTEKYRRKNLPLPDNLRESSILSAEISKGSAYVVLGKFTYPSGLQKENRVIFLIPKNIPEPDGRYGDSKIYHFYDDYFNGPSVEFNAGSEWAAGF